jgi:hypothetical protein
MFVVALSLRLQFEPRRGWESIALLLILVAAAVLLINPVTLARTGKAGYSIHSDHKGAADFIHSIHPHLAGIPVTDDCVQQVYHPGHINVSGTSEFKGDGPDYISSFCKCEALENPKFEPVYLGRDGLTHVWKICELDRTASAR